MVTPSENGVCNATGMDAALGRYGEFIDIRSPGVFDAWRSTPGLRCLVCRHPVEAYRSSRRRPFVRHGKGHAAAGAPHAKKSADETFLHYRLTYWVRAELQARKSPDADIEVRLGRRIAEVYGQIDGRGYAVEVLWSPLDYPEASARTRCLFTAGVDEVLWLTRTCAWVEKLPVLGIESFPGSGDDYQARTGFLTHRANSGLLPISVPVSVRGVLCAWTAGELVWAYRDHKRAGWAAVTDWRLHTRAQADEILRQKRRLAAAHAERDDLRRRLQEAHATIEQHVETCARIETRNRELAELLEQVDGSLRQCRRDLREREDERHAVDRRLAEQERDIEMLKTTLGQRRRLIGLLCVVCVLLPLIVLLV